MLDPPVSAVVDNADQSICICEVDVEDPLVTADIATGSV